MKTRKGEVTKRLLEIEKLYRSGEYEEVLRKVNEFKDILPEYRLSVIGCLIDIGGIKARKDLVEEAVNVFEADNSDNLPEYLYYNAANGYLTLFHMCLEEGGGYFENGKYALRAIELFKISDQSKPEVLTNQANALDDIGRPIEAINIYDQALKIDNKFGMALGNKALAIRKLAVISEFQSSYLIFSYQHYIKALENKDSILSYANKSSIVTFQKEAEYIKTLFKDEPSLLSADLTHPQLSLKKNSKFLKYYTEFCLSNDLYLNLHFFSNITDASVGDTLGINFVRSHDQKPHKGLNDLSLRLNEIKEAYIAARLALVQSQYSNRDFSNISEQTLIINPLDYSVSNIYTSTLKMAFKEAFSVFDKIAIFLNFYLELGFEEDDRRLSYHSIWYKNLNKQDGINGLFNAHDPNIFGLYSLLHEIRSSEYDEIRNALTHRYVRLFKLVDAKDGYVYEDFVYMTIDLLSKVKCAVIYLHNFINNKETSKRSIGKKSISLPINTEQWLDIWE